MQVKWSTRLSLRRDLEQDSGHSSDLGQKKCSDLCDEHRICQARTERLVLEKQVDPLFEPISLLMKTHTPLTDDPAQEDLFQRYEEQVERLSQQDRVGKFCTDAGFLTTVDVGQYFMTKDTEDFSHGLS